MRVVRFEPVYRGARGRRCPNRLFYGYTLDLSVADAISAGTYEGTAESTVELSGGGGSSQSIQVPLEVQLTPVPEAPLILTQDCQSLICRPWVIK